MADPNTAVFSTFDRQDGLDDRKAPRCKLLERARQQQGPSMTLADVAAERLARLRVKRDGRPVRDPQMLWFYERETVGDCRYPTPADAGFYPRFRAVGPGDPHFCGRTFPVGAAPEDHAAGRCGENEVVHANAPIPCEKVFVRGLGKYSPVRLPRRAKTS